MRLRGRPRRVPDNSASYTTLPSPRPLYGVALVLLAVCCFATMDTTVRHVGQRVPVLLILWVRYALQALLSALWIVAFRTGGFRTTQPRFQALRGTLLLLSSAFTFVALQHVPVPELTSINMMGPVLVTVLAAGCCTSRCRPGASCWWPVALSVRWW